MQETFLSLNKNAPMFESEDEKEDGEMFRAFIQLSDQVNLMQA